MHTHNSKARTEQRRTEAKERNERNAADVIDCSCGRRHHREWSGCPLIDDSAADRTRIGFAYLGQVSR